VDWGILLPEVTLVAVSRSVSNNCVDADGSM
jgi:hypothetical protein